MSDYIQQNCSILKFDNSNSWVILSKIEQSIKAKIERYGIPLKKWNLKIYRGILTGFNEAFIISNETRKEILNNCKNITEYKRTDELIRPILRGRDIKRDSYEYADLYLITTFPSKNYDIEEYPAIKKHLLSFGIKRLEQTGEKYIINGEEIRARKKTNNKWFETQDSISYWDEFNKPHIVYCEIGPEMNACLLEPGIYINNKLYMITGKFLEYLLIFFNSKLFNKIIIQSANVTGGKGVDFINKIKCIIPSEKQLKTAIQLLKNKATDEMKDEFINTIFELSDEQKKYLENS